MKSLTLTLLLFCGCSPAFGDSTHTVVVNTDIVIKTRTQEGLIDFENAHLTEVKTYIINEPQEKKYKVNKIPKLVKVDLSNPNWCWDILPPLDQQFPLFMFDKDIIEIREYYRSHCNQWAKEVGYEFVQNLYLAKDRDSEYREKISRGINQYEKAK